MFMQYLVAVILHELAHAKAANYRGYKLRHISLMPYGAMLSGKEEWSAKDGLIIALAGPICNAALSVCTLALWWLIPEAYNYTLDFFKANITLVLFNLLPCFPLDGARIILGLIKNRIRALKILKISGVTLGVIFVVLGILSIWYSFNVTLIFAGVFLIMGAISGSEKEKYCHIASLMPFMKRYSAGVERKTVYIDANLPLYRLLKHIKDNTVVDFVLVDKNGSEIGRMDERELSELCQSRPMNERTGKALETTSHHNHD